MGHTVIGETPPTLAQQFFSLEQQGPQTRVEINYTTSDLYNWGAQNIPFSDNPKELISLFQTILFNPSAHLG